MGIAAAVTQPVLYTVLVTCGAVVAIGVGGGLIDPMQDRWERMLTAAERETSTQVAAYHDEQTADGGQAQRLPVKEGLVVPRLERPTVRRPPAAGDRGLHETRA